MSKEGVDRQTLENLSPEKYGKNAYQKLSYTPSKLSENVLYRQATTMKKVQEQSKRARLCQASNSFLNQRIEQLIEEKNGLELSLNNQIIMYKKIIDEMKDKHEERLRNMQKKMNQQIQKIIIQNQQNAKFVECQKQNLENKISQLQELVNSLQNNLLNSGSNNEQLLNDHQKLQLKFTHLEQKLSEKCQQIIQNGQKSKKQYDISQKNTFQMEKEWQNKLEKILKDKTNQINTLQRIHRGQIENLQINRDKQLIIKKNEIQNLRNTFDTQANKLQNIIQVCQDKNSSLQSQNILCRDKIIQITKDNQKIIGNSIYQKSCLLDELKLLKTDNTFLHQQICRLKEVLLQSSTEIMNHQSSYLMAQLRQMGIQNEVLNHLKIMNDQQSNRCRTNYKMSRHL